jgi:hypothetical protein
LSDSLPRSISVTECVLLAHSMMLFFTGISFYSI